jgi:nicotinate-nucleotide pyrophosphorylase (carboxylating)
MDLSNDVIHTIVERALHEDVGQGDLTTLAVIPAEATARANIVFKEDGVVAGLPVLAAVFKVVDTTLDVAVCAEEGAHLDAGAVVARISGRARGILTGERVALNFIQRLSGIATLTARYVAAVGDTPVRVLDTRKTTPDLRALEKYAVRIGGGVNHRSGLYDAIMLKDNHLALLAAHGCGLGEAVRRARAEVGPMVRIEVEVESAADALTAAEAGADMILLDNMSFEAMREAVARVKGRAILEASGGITLETIHAVAETGVDYISVGALTHSAHALDISLDLIVP